MDDYTNTGNHHYELHLVLRLYSPHFMWMKLGRLSHSDTESTCNNKVVREGQEDLHLKMQFSNLQFVPGLFY